MEAKEYSETSDSETNNLLVMTESYVVICTL